MSFDNNSQLDAGRVGGGGRGVAVGGGIGGTLLLLVVGLLFGQDGIDALTGGGGGQDTGTQGSAQQERAGRRRTGEDAHQYTGCRMIAPAPSPAPFSEEYPPATTGGR